MNIAKQEHDHIVTLHQVRHRLLPAFASQRKTFTIFGEGSTAEVFKAGLELVCWLLQERVA
jgi:hypothetical protein